LITSGKDTSVFIDITGHWAAQSIAAVKEAGIMEGYPDETFRPNGLLLRGEAVRVLNAIFKRPLPQSSASSSWPDVSAKHWALQEIEAASSYVQWLPDGQVMLLKTR